MEQSKEMLRAFVGRHIRGRTIADDDQIFALGFVNSMFAMQLVLFLEKNFKIAIANEDLELANFQSINAMAALIEKKTSSAQNGSN
jgi:methoxymalonate biosynthesis acyl carrier protein